MLQKLKSAIDEKKARASYAPIVGLQRLPVTIATEQERQNIRSYAQAWGAMYGSVVFWVGAWSLMDVSVNDIEFRWQQHLRDFTIGTALLLLTDTFLQCGYVNGALLPERVTQFEWLFRSRSTRARMLGALMRHLRVVLATMGSVAMWNGLYNLMYWSPHEDWLAGLIGRRYPYPWSVLKARGLKSGGSIVVGLSLIASSGTLVAVSCVPVNVPEVQGPSYASPWREKRAALRTAGMSLVGQVALWFGVYEMCLTWCPGATLDDYRRCLPLPEENPWKPLALMSLGLVAFLATDSFISSAFLDKDPSGLEPGDADAAPSHATLVLYLRCVMACIGSAVHNTGLWVLVDDTLFARLWRNCSWRGEAAPDAWPCSTRSGLFIGFGYLVMLGLGSAAGNVGVGSLTPTPMIQRSASDAAARPSLSPRASSFGIEAAPPPEERFGIDEERDEGEGGGGGGGGGGGEGASFREEEDLPPITPYDAHSPVVPARGRRQGTAQPAAHPAPPRDPTAELVE